MLFNRVLERLRAQRASLRLLREEGRARRSRTPVLLVPSVLGVRRQSTGQSVKPLVVGVKQCA